jgi:2-polyprenyl-3-methyl-5-hydroxy-6-metoxy-1,4-benzoquinol methylase
MAGSGMSAYMLHGVSLLASRTPVQLATQGVSGRDIQMAALRASTPKSGLDWIDIGCGTGDLLRAVRDRSAPRTLVGTDIIDWLTEDLRDDVDLVTGPAELVANRLGSADRVLMIEVLEHLESPWTTLRAAARLVRPGGRLVVTTPNIGSLRHRIELPIRGQLTSFRPDNLAHLTPVLPHTVRHLLRAEGLAVSSAYVGADLLPAGRGRRWPHSMRGISPSLTHRSVLFVGTRASDEAN